MSDPVALGLIGGVVTLATTLGLPIVNHYIGRKDRSLAAEVVKTKNTEMSLKEQAHNSLIALYRSHMTPEQLMTIDRILTQREAS